MARTDEGAQLSQEHREAQLTLRAATLRDLLQLWPLVEIGDLDTLDRFAAAVAVLVREAHQRSAALGGAYYAEFRRLEQVDGVAQVVQGETPSRELIRALLRTVGVNAAVTALRAGQSAQAAAQTTLVQVTGAAGLYATNGGRDTILRTFAADREASVWQRITSRRPCAFCRMLASRGGVYRSERTAGFRAHRACSCFPEVAYRGSRMPAASRQFEQEWLAAQRAARAEDDLDRGTENDALNAYRRWLAAQESTEAEASA